MHVQAMIVAGLTLLSVSAVAAKAPPRWNREMGIRVVEPAEESVVFVSVTVDVPVQYPLVTLPTKFDDSASVLLTVQEMPKYRRIILEAFLNPARALPSYLSSWTIEARDPLYLDHPVRVRRVKAVLDSGAISRTFRVEILTQGDAHGDFLPLK